MPTEKAKLLVTLDERTAEIVAVLREGTVNLSEYVRECLLERDREVKAALRHLQVTSRPPWSGAELWSACTVLATAELSPYFCGLADVERVLAGAGYLVQQHDGDAWEQRRASIGADENTWRSLLMIAREIASGNTGLEERIYATAARKRR